MKEEKTLNEIADQYSVHVNQVHQWRQHVLDGLPGLHQSFDYQTSAEVYLVTPSPYYGNDAQLELLKN